MQKRISALLLTMVIVIGSVLGGNTLKVKAASVAVSEEFAVELTMMLYNLLETVAISSGIKDGLDDYESGSSLYDAFIASVESMAEPPFYDTVITVEDGSKMTVKEALDAVESTLGSNALKLPTSETFAKYRVISGTGGNEPDPTPTPSSDPDSTPVPDTGYKDPFTYIQDVLVSSTLLSAMAGIFADLYAGKIDGLDPDMYYESGFSNNLRQNIDGNYIYDLSIVSAKTGASYGQIYSVKDYDVSLHYSNYKVLVGTLTTNPNTKMLQLYIYGSTAFGFLPSKQINILPSVANAGMSSTYPMYYILNSESVITDIPLFSSYDYAKEYCLSQSLTGLLNGEAYDFPDLATSTAERLHPLTGYEFAPGRLPGINAALSTAAAALPEPGLDPAENTEAYKNALNAALTAALPEPAPEPEPEPDPSPDPGTDGEGESYKRDLRLIFPFCIPFDFIHFIKALSADPVAPCFKIPIKLDSLGIDMVLELDLSWMDPIMEIFRLGELGCFVIMLMAATKKMIGW
jgi:hypothetical protein|nr:MAG TPA: hypothetical protein [Inoviridae sp.]